MSTTFDDLHKLATLCLCQSHVYQVYDVVSEWEQALQKTMRQYHLLSSSSRNSMVTNKDVQRFEQTIASLKRKLSNKRAAADVMATKSKDKEASLLEETLLWKKKYENLDHETKVAQKISANKIRDLEVKISSLENSFQRDQREISAQRHSLSDLRTAKKKLEADVQQSATHLEALKAERISADDEAQLLKAKLQQSTMQNQTLQAEKIGTNNKIESLQGDLRNLQTKVGDLEKSNEFMAIELAAKNLALRGEETRVKELMKVISNLEISEAHLKQVIASCWLHRIYNWLTGSRLVF
ncbi:uncharacterized protein FTOL_02372 [Fusarium torulosum]|uniref:Uncharacterized protein n=1 Tax=Fusarium torulosum TaxID=33205 RepID=A0AAE8SEA5_9HYPO|nr:uncharacterized protein FTOL_02372 [Fusarium torulosum]